MAKILISIDHKWRDLPGHVYAGLLLEKMGHEVHFVRNRFVRQYVAGIKPDLVLMIHLLEKESQEYAKELKKQGVLVALMPTEGIPTLEKYRSFAAGVENDLSGVDIQFVWNEPMKTALSKNPTIEDENIYIIGVPRFDFYRKPLSGMLLSRKEFIEKYNLKPGAPIITFATNFTQASFHLQNQSFFRNDARRLGYRKILNDIAGDYKDIPRRDYESRDIAVSSFIKLVRDFPNVNFVIKLHPSEDHMYYYDIYKSELGDCHDRVKIIGQDYIWDVLNATDVELKRSCTTGVESWILGKPTIEMKLNPNEWYYSPEHASGSDVVTDYKTLRSRVEYYLNGGVISEEKKEKREAFLSKWCYKVDGNATKRMVDVIDFRLRVKRNKKLPFILKDYLIYCVLMVSNYKIHDMRVYGISNMLFGKRIDRLGRVDKYFNGHDLLFWKRKISAVLEA